MAESRQTPEYAAVLAAMRKRTRCRFTDLARDTKLPARVVSHAVNLMLSSGSIELDITSSEYVLIKGG